MSCSEKTKQNNEISPAACLHLATLDAAVFFIFIIIFCVLNCLMDTYALVSVLRLIHFPEEIVVFIFCDSS